MVEGKFFERVKCNLGGGEVTKVPGREFTFLQAHCKDCGVGSQFGKRPLRVDFGNNEERETIVTKCGSDNS